MAGFVGFNASDFAPLDTESVTESADRLLAVLGDLADVPDDPPSVEVRDQRRDDSAEQHRALTVLARPHRRA